MASNDGPGVPTPPGEHSIFDRLAGIWGGKRPSFQLPKPEDDEEEGMLRMSFMDHLEELRHRLLMVVYGMIVARKV